MQEALMPFQNAGESHFRLGDPYLPTLNLHPAQEWGTLMFFCDYQSPGLTGAAAVELDNQLHHDQQQLWSPWYGTSYPKHPITSPNLADDGRWKSQEVNSVIGIAGEMTHNRFSAFLSVGIWLPNKRCGFGILIYHFVRDGWMFLASTHMPHVPHHCIISPLLVGFPRENCPNVLADSILIGPSFAVASLEAQTYMIMSVFWCSFNDQWMVVLWCWVDSYLMIISYYINYI